eukprot:scaffold220784_cov32-Tisochrysis_lutea.AAC.14
MGSIFTREIAAPRRAPHNIRHLINRFHRDDREFAKRHRSFVVMRGSSLEATCTAMPKVYRSGRPLTHKSQAQGMGSNLDGGEWARPHAWDGSARNVMSTSAAATAVAAVNVAAFERPNIAGSIVAGRIPTLLQCNGRLQRSANMTLTVSACCRFHTANREGCLILTHCQPICPRQMDSCH